MNYHIFPQDKFFNAYIEDIHKLHEESNNIFLVRGDKGEMPFLTTPREVEYLGNEDNHILDRLRSIEATDKLFVSGYDISIGRLILKAGLSCDLYVFIMGYEFFCEPEGYHDDWLFDVGTRWFVKRNMRPYSILGKSFTNWFRLPLYLYKSYKYNKKIHERYKEKLEQIKRIDYVVTAKNDVEELNFIKKIYPTFRAKHAPGNFNQNIDAAKNVEVKYCYSEREPLNILLGNSAYPTNNHVDVLKYMNKGLLNRCNVYAPLSYGDTQYADYVESYMVKHMGDRFHPLRTYMPIDEYIKFLCSMDIAVMNHNRQQAYGNICTMLTLGKPVFLKSKSVVWPLLKSMGIEDIYDVSMLSKVDFGEVTAKAFANRKRTIQILSEYHSEATRLANVKELIS